MVLNKFQSLVERTVSCVQAVARPFLEREVRFKSRTCPIGQCYRRLATAAIFLRKENDLVTRR